MLAAGDVLRVYSFVSCALAVGLMLAVVVRYAATLSAQARIEGDGGKRVRAKLWHILLIAFSHGTLLGAGVVWMAMHYGEPLTMWSPVVALSSTVTNAALWVMLVSLASERARYVYDRR